MTEFLITGKIPVPELKKRSGFIPTSSWSAGDLIGQTRRTRPNNGIALATAIEDRSDYAPQLAEFLAALKVHSACITDLLSSGCSTRIAIHFYKSRGGKIFPAIALTPAQLKFLTDHACALDIDIL